MPWFLVQEAGVAMSSLDFELPIHVDPYQDESGYGYLLRALSRNGSNLPELRRLLSLREMSVFTSKDAATLSALFKVPSSFFELALPSVEGANAQKFRCYGHDLWASNHLRRNFPQVCAHCIRINGYAKAIWDVSLTTVCLEHGCVLTDECKHCKAKLRWDRPRVDISHCGHFIRDVENVAITPQLLQYQKLLNTKFYGFGELNSIQFSSYLKQASFGALLLVIAAFGVVEKPFQSMRASAFRGSRTTFKWIELIDRALFRLEQSEHRDFDMWAMNAEVSEALLVRVLECSPHGMDAQLAADLLCRIFKSRSRSFMNGRYPSLSQQTLF